MDNLDKQILQTLQTDASLSVAEVAEKVGLSKTACWRRMQKLEEDGYVLGTVTLLNKDKLNLGLPVFISIKTNQHNNDWYEKFCSIVTDIAEVIGVYRMSGELDYLLHAVVPDMQGYDALYKKLIEADLNDVSASFVMETIKSTTQLPLTHM
ncbi:Lrp/AsnC family transcriptional regulator [Neptunicella marina]|uniref:Lrp/AsnC family transcriptional regulator n=1 Tax=Neptunicella marina TaxID=2125989 RepID=A0A8J6M3P6_9ALTE|nr:Lrp/AsnC family transcriptional regulator [Neptunicella marina]MBC3767708.1 Lrp/AsnC family transcriptional regulator [Neptunicella marina]